jgi:hypothetical protein
MTGASNENKLKLVPGSEVSVTATAPAAAVEDCDQQ